MTPGGPADRARWRSRVAWLILIWATSVAFMALAACLIKLLMRAVGLSA